MPDLNESFEHPIRTLDYLHMDFPDMSVLRGGVYAE